MISKGFRIPDHYTLEDAYDHPKIGPILKLASAVKMGSKYDVRYIEAEFTNENWFFAVIKRPELNNKVEKLYA